MDLRNESDIAIAGIRHWNRPNSAATGQSVTLYERHPHTAEHAGNPIGKDFFRVEQSKRLLSEARKF